MGRTVQNPFVAYLFFFFSSQWCSIPTLHQTNLHDYYWNPQVRTDDSVVSHTPFFSNKEILSRRINRIARVKKWWWTAGKGCRMDVERYYASWHENDTQNYLDKVIDSKFNIHTLNHCAPDTDNNTRLVKRLEGEPPRFNLSCLTRIGRLDIQVSTLR